VYWGSQIANPKEKQLYNAIIKPQYKLNYVSPGAPTYWPADPMKLPDFIDFAITKRISQSMITAEALPELSSDHCPVIFHLLHQLQHIERPCRLTSNRTNWARHKKYVCSHTGFSSPLETEQDIDQFAGYIESILVAAAKASTPQDNHVCSTKFNNTSRNIELLVLEKRRHRREEHRSPGAKSKLKAASRRLTKALKKEEADAHRHKEQGIIHK